MLSALPPIDFILDRLLDVVLTEENPGNTRELAGLLPVSGTR